MSLLIKALEQAAKDRDAARGAATAPLSRTAPGPSIEPTLEPAPPPKGAPGLETTSRASPALEAPAPAGRGPASLALDARPTERRKDPSAAALAQIDAEQQRARAAAVVQASAQSGQLVFAYLRGNPVMMFGSVAALFGIAFGIYVYLQIAQPGLFVRQAATSPQQTVAQQPTAATRPPDAPTSDASVASLTGPGRLAPAAGSPVANSTAPLSVAAPGGTTGNVGTLQRSAAGAAPIPTASVILGSADSAREASPAGEVGAGIGRDGGAKREASSSRTRTEGVTRPSAASAGAAEPASARRDAIAVSPSATQPRVNPALSQAYTALQTGNIDEARGLYTKLSQNEPLNVDALLALAYIAAQENRSDDAMKLYLRLLQINPRHAAAQGALIGLMGRADPVASETRLKQLIAREPSAFLHFILGNLYADQSMWPQAQQAYFQAHHLEADNPDYAYNLAVALDHLRQNKLALGFYTRAEQLAKASGRANFNVAHARERVNILSSQLE